MYRAISFRIWKRSFSTLPGKATAVATESYFKQVESELNRAIFQPLLTPIGLYASPIGFGTRKVDGDYANKKALRVALTSGVNLVETSSIYGDTQAQSLIGEVVSELVEDKRLQREQLILATKLGAAIGPTVDIARSAGAVDGSTFNTGEKAVMSLAPAFLKYDLDRALHRMRLECMDFALLHNPESALDDPKTDPDRFYTLLGMAFEHLEEEVARGRLQYYGISSNTLALPASARNHLALDRILQVAASISSNNHFRVIQYPLNIVEGDAAIIANLVNNTVTVADLATKHKLVQLTNRPLRNCTVPGYRQLIDHSAYEFKGRDVNEEISDAVNRALFIESQYPGAKPASEHVKALNEVGAGSKGRRSLFGSLFGGAKKDSEQMPPPQPQQQQQQAQGKVEDAETETCRPTTLKEDTADDSPLPPVEEVGWAKEAIEPAFSETMHKLRKSRKAEVWTLRYSLAMNALFEGITQMLGHRSYHESKLLKAKLVQACPELAGIPTLQQMAVAVLLSLSYGGTNHITLVGMSQLRYVTELVGELPKHEWRIPRESALRALRLLWINKEEMAKLEQEQEERERKQLQEMIARKAQELRNMQQNVAGKS